MSGERLDLADFLSMPRLHMAKHALSAPNAGIEQIENFPYSADKAEA